MKKTLYIIAMLAGVSLCGSCSLQEDSRGFTTRSNSYLTTAQCQACVDACYYPLTQVYTTTYAWAVEVPTDLWWINTSTPDPKCEISPSKPGVGTTVWRYCYQGIMRCNEVIECIGASTIPDSDKRSMTAEARVLRALYYYHLTNFFDGVPFYTYMVADQTAQEKVRRLPRTDANLIRSTLYEDLKENALPYLAQVRTSEAPGNRAGYALALMLMGKFAMWYKDWTEAEWALDRLETLYGDFTEENYPLDNTRWSRKNTPESIFEIQHEWSESGIQFQGKMCRTYYPANIAKIWDNTDVTDGLPGAWIEGTYDGYLDDVYLPKWGHGIPSVSAMRATWHLGCFRTKSGTDQAEDTSTAQYCPGDRLFDPLPLTYGDYNKYTKRWNLKIDTEALENGVNAEGRKIDRRIRYVLGLGNLDPTSNTYGDTFKEVRTQGRPCAGEKFWVPDMQANFDSNNYKILRYADAILMMAETQCMQGKYAEALDYINLVRARSGVDPFTGYSDEASVMKIIRDERARELAGECHRKYDLVRWGIWYTETCKYAPSGTKEYILANIQPCHEYYPIPDTECALTADENGVPALSNPAYSSLESKE